MYECGNIRFLQYDGTLFELNKLLRNCIFIWFIIFNLSLFISQKIFKKIPLSCIKNENSQSFIAHLFICSIKSIICSSLANYTLYNYYYYGNYNKDYIFISGILFLSFEINDLITTINYNLINNTMIIHHITHIILGYIIIGNCFSSHIIVPILLAQDTTALPLNIYKLFRNRLEKNHILPKYSFMLFSISFFIWRIVLNTFATTDYLLTARNDLVKQEIISDLNSQIIGIFSLLGLSLQWYWGLKNLKNVIKNLFYYKNCNISE